MVKLEYILALDYGEKRIGVAVAHEVARLPRPLMTLQNNPDVVSEIIALIEKEQVSLVLVGLPRGMDGGYTAQTHAAEAFGKQLKTRVGVPVVLADETLTSVDAEAQLAGTKHSKGDIDALAAAYILERYLIEHPTGKETHGV
jgi:putative Holliday junction resolvase